MDCMKCGAAVPEGQVFCDHCLSVMEAYPIKRNIHVHLPKRNDDAEPVKRPVKKKRAPTAEEQVSLLRLKVLRLRLTAAILAFLLCAACAFLGLTLYGDYVKEQTGWNYTIDTSMND